MAPPAAAAAPTPSVAAIARQTEGDFPADPEVWLAAAKQLSASEGAEAARLRRDAELFSGPALPQTGGTSALGEATRRLMADGIPAALLWLDRPPAGTDADLRAFRADLLARRRLLLELKAAVGSGAWGPVDEDTLDLVFAAAAARDRQHSPLERDLWAEAIRCCGSDGSRLRVLERFSLGLDLDQETEATFQAEIDLPRTGLAAARRYAVWASYRDDNLWQTALARWRSAAPAEADSYARAVKQRRAAAP